MVDYFPVLDRAVAALDPNTKDARRVLYDRARRALVDGLRSSDPTLSDTDLKTQSVALEAAIRRVETEALQRTGQPPPMPELAVPVRPTPPPAVPPPDLIPDLAREPAAPTEEVGQDQPPLDDDRKPFRLIAAGIAGLLVIGAGMAAYTFWPTKSTPPSQRGIATKRADPEAAGSAPYVYLRQPVYYRTNHPVGTIVVDKQQRFLYVVRPSVSALRYGIGVGSECAASAGLYQIVRKEEWPGLKTASDEERNRNPFGARAMYLSKDSRIHGTNMPSSIGQSGSIGCFRLTNDDVIYLYDRAPLETRVVVLN